MKINYFFAMAFVYLIIIAGTVEASTVTVDDSGGANYTTIQEAVNNANNGDTILIYSGTYTENVIVNKWVTIRSKSGNPDDTIVQAADPRDHIFNVTKDNVTIGGFKITGANYFPSAGIYINGVNDIIISDNKLSNNEIGIDLHGSNHNMLNNNIASDNKMGIRLSNSNSNDLVNNDAFNEHVGIYLWGSSNNILSNNNASLNGEYGIWIEDASNNNTLSNNVMSNNDHGVYLDESSNNNTLANNNVNSNLVGIGIKDSRNNTVKDNFLSNNRKGIAISDSNNQIYNNEIRDREIHDGNTSPIPFIDPVLTIIILGIAFVFMRKEQK